MFNIPVNCDGNKLSACHKMANILTVSRKSFHLIGPPLESVSYSDLSRPSGMILIGKMVRFLTYLVEK